MSDEEVIDLHAMRVTELKQELKARGLTVSGTKPDLITRLENYMKEHEGVEVVEEDVDDEGDLEDSIEEPVPEPKEATPPPPVKAAEKSSPKVNGHAERAASPPPPNFVSTTEEDEEPAAAGANPLKGMSETDRKQARAGRFATGTVSGTTTDELKKKTERASRFGLPINNASKEKIASTQSSSDKLKDRANRFGMNTQSNRIQAAPETDAKRLKARSDRFGTTVASMGCKVSTGMSDKERAAKRLQRFGGQ